LLVLRNEVFCYEQMSWRAAQEECQQKGMQMVTLKTQRQMESAAQELKKRRQGKLRKLCFLFSEFIYINLFRRWNRILGVRVGHWADGGRVSVGRRIGGGR
jgi:hypothetical protein